MQLHAHKHGLCLACALCVDLWVCCILLCCVLMCSDVSVVMPWFSTPSPCRSGGRPKGSKDNRQRSARGEGSRYKRTQQNKKLAEKLAEMLKQHNADGSVGAAINPDAEGAAAQPAQNISPHMLALTLLKPAVGALMHGWGRGWVGSSGSAGMLAEAWRMQSGWDGVLSHCARILG